MPESKAMDINVPNAARVYDYSLGGNHNFEADRQVAEYMFTLVPSTKKWVRLLRAHSGSRGDLGAGPVASI